MAREDESLETYLTDGRSSDWCREQELRCEIDPPSKRCVHCGERERAET